MTRRLALLALAASALPGLAYAQFDHAQTVANEVMMRRAQIRAALCEAQKTGRMRPLPPYPGSGTGGRVPMPVCPQTDRVASPAPRG
ncbi:MAG: hypothetical protein HY985_17005 [Magnetospirillum sp.]|nr:hypothetical protein [Magnetospirillum sp.]